MASTLNYLFTRKFQLLEELDELSVKQTDKLTELEEVTLSIQKEEDVLMDWYNAEVGKKMNGVKNRK